MKVYFRQIMLVLSVFLFFPLGAQNMSKFYISKSTEQGTLYFILPHKAKLLSGEAYEALNCDFTYLSTQDSVTMLATFRSPRVQVPEYLSFELDRERKFPIQVIYTNRSKKNWETRISCHIPYSIWSEQMQSNDAPVYCLEFKNGAEIRYGYSKSTWRKRRDAYLIFFDILKLN